MFCLVVILLDFQVLGTAVRATSLSGPSARLSLNLLLIVQNLLTGEISESWKEGVQSAT